MPLETRSHNGIHLRQHKQQPVPVPVQESPVPSHKQTSFQSMSVSAVRVTLQPAHGYIPLVVIGAGLVGTWAGFNVGVARKQFNVPYPQMYAEKKDKNANEFNCVQRAHQNVLEKLPLFYAMLATSSIYRPAIAAVAGVVRIAGFVMYVKGYSTGDPGKRRQGSFGSLGTIVLLGLSLEASLRLLGYL